MSMQTSFSHHIVLEIGRANNNMITLNSRDVRLYFLGIDLRPNKNLLKPCCFTYFYICSIRSLLPLSPGSGFTVTQPRLCTKGKGQNNKNQNVKSQKVDEKIRTSQVFFKLIRTSKVTKMEVDHNIESDKNHQLD